MADIAVATNVAIAPVLVVPQSLDVRKGFQRPAVPTGPINVAFRVKGPDQSCPIGMARSHPHRSTVDERDDKAVFASAAAASRSI